MIGIKLYLKQFKGIAEDEDIVALDELGDDLFDLRVANVNSTHYGGGVAELLMGLIPLFNRIGIHATWHVMTAGIEFFLATKLFYNALQGQKIELTEDIKNKYRKSNAANAKRINLREADVVVIHDHQPLGFIEHYEKREPWKKQPWVWRCHADIHTPNPRVWSFFKPYISRYDKVIVSMEKYKKKDLAVPQNVVYPSIDPTNEKNMVLKEKQITRILSRYDIERDKPLLTQISRFDKWKDPVGVIRSYKKAKKKVDCKLVLLGEAAADDPEGPAVYEQVMKESKSDPDIHIISKHSGYLVNALQSSASVVIQKSLKEGFALTVAEALWKGTPVIGGNHGGIPLQIINGKTGYLVDTVPETAKRITKLLENPKLAERMGKRGKEHIRKNFLITRHAIDYLKLYKKLVG